MSGDKAVGYVRVSSEEQAREGVSLAAQEERIQAYATMRGLDLIAIYREEGVSAKVPLKQRTEGAKAVQSLVGKQARHIITVKLDRLFRNAADALGQSAAWDKAKCALHIIDMGGSIIDTTTAVGKMFFTMMAGFAEMERTLISERTRTALRHKKAHSAVYSRITPLGFTRKGGKLVANDAEMETVRTIQRMRSEGVSLKRIAYALNASGAPTKLGGTWRQATIDKVLRIHAKAGSPFAQDAGYSTRCA